MLVWWTDVENADQSQGIKINLKQLFANFFRLKNVRGEDWLNLTFAKSIYVWSFQFETKIKTYLYNLNKQRHKVSYVLFKNFVFNPTTTLLALLGLWTLTYANSMYALRPQQEVTRSKWKWATMLQKALKYFEGTLMDSNEVPYDFSSLFFLYFLSFQTAQFSTRKS